MKYTSIYKNGKVEHFYIKANQKEYDAFLQNYFILTSIDKKRLGNIKEMDCLFSNDYKHTGSEAVYIGKQYHGYGYSASADVYGELIQTIKKLYKNELTDEDIKKLDKINTHDDLLEVDENLLEKLGSLSNDKLYKKFKKWWVYDCFDYYNFNAVSGYILFSKDEQIKNKKIKELASASFFYITKQAVFFMGIKPIHPHVSYTICRRQCVILKLLQGCVYINLQ